MLATAGYILASLTLSYSGESEVLHMPASLNNRLVEQPSLSLGMAGAIGYKCWGISVDSLFISSVDMVEKSFVMWICLQSATESIRTHFWLTLKPTQILTISVTMDTMCTCFFPMNLKWAFTVFSLSLFLYIWSEHTEEAWLPQWSLPLCVQPFESNLLLRSHLLLGYRPSSNSRQAFLSVAIAYSSYHVLLI